MKKYPIFIKVKCVFLCFMLINLTFGCGSARFVTSKKKPQIGLSDFDFKYNIIKSNFEFKKPLWGTNSDADLFFPHCFEKIGTDEYESCSLSPEFIMDKAIELYPDIFSRDPSSLPIEVSGFIDFRGENLVPTLLIICTVGIVGGIFPVPGTVYFDINTDIKMKNSLSCSNIDKSEKFEVECHNWMTVFTPLGLIPVPGQSDLPKTQGGINAMLGTLEMNELTKNAIIYSIIDNIKIKKE